MNPGGTTSVSVSTTLLSPIDSSNGRIDSIRFTSFPTNVTTITINGTSYTSGTFPVGGVKVVANSSGQPNVPISIDPVNGAVTAVISYKPIDNAGFESSTTWTVDLPFYLLSLSGNVYNDSNGLVDNTVNGPGISTPSSIQLHANLLDGSNNVVATTAVGVSGTYSFSGLYPASYNVQVSTTQGTVGNAAPATVLPTNWINTGENLGTSAGNDGSVNGKLPVTLVSSNVSNANLGIEKISNADTKSYSGLNPNDFNIASGNSNYPYKMSLANASGTSNGNVNGLSSAVLPGRVSGTDLEDGNYGGSTGSTGQRKFVLTTLPDSANDVMVYYNGTNYIALKPGPAGSDSSFTYWNSAQSRYEIPSFNPANLFVFMRKNGHTNFSFNYAWKDAANVLGNPASYSVSAYGALPVTWLSFKTSWNGNNAKLQWATTMEINNDHFEIERSFDNKLFEYIGQKKSSTNGNTNYYTFEDMGAKQAGQEVLYYRIKQIDNDGQYTYSTVQMLNTQNTDKNAEVNITVYPNPIVESTSMQISGINNGLVSYTISDIEGKIIRTDIISTATGPETIKVIDMAGFAKGIYLLNIQGNNINQTIRLVKIDK